MLSTILEEAIEKEEGSLTDTYGKLVYEELLNEDAMEILLSNLVKNNKADVMFEVHDLAKYISDNISKSSGKPKTEKSKWRANVIGRKT